MASQVVHVSCTDLAVLEVHSYVWGYQYHAWTPAIGEALLLKQESEYCKDRYAVVLLKDGDTIVGFAKVTGESRSIEGAIMDWRFYAFTAFTLELEFVQMK